MPTSKPLINYFNRDFESLKNDLVNYTKNYHSDRFKYFNSASPDMMYLELLAYMGDSLNYQVDKSFNESFRTSAQSRESLVRMAKDMGFNDFYAKPSSTQVVVSINVPYTTNSNGSSLIVDSQYLFSIKPGLTIQADNGAIFECLEEINFSQSYNRKITPNYDTNGILIDYTVEKTAVVFAGETKIQRFYITQATSKPFLEILIDDKEVTEVLGIVAVAGSTSVIPSDEEFRADADNVYVEVKELAQDKVFIETSVTKEISADIVNAYTDMTINYGEWVNKPKRFIVRRDKNNNTSVIFGSTLIDYTDWNTLIGQYSTSQITNFSLNQILNNMALGEVPGIDTTLFIKYRTGAGVKTNVLTNTLTSILQKQISLPTTVTSYTTLDQVRNSLKVKSNLPAVGGSNVLSNEELRNSIGKVFAANDRGVSYEDIKALIGTMPAKFGQPFRISYEEIKPQLLNYSQVKSYVESQVDVMLNAITTVDRELAAQTLKTWLSDYPNQIAASTVTGSNLTLSEISNSLNGSSNITDHKLWYGEKCRLYVLGIDQDLQPTTLYKDSNGILRSPNTDLKTNIKNFLKEKRVIGDWIDVVDARVVNFQIEFSIMADKKNKQKVLIDCLTKLRDYFNVYNWQINQPIFKANVSTILQELEGVLNVVDIKFYNIFDTDVDSGRVYSPKELGRYKYLSATSKNNQNNKFEMLDYNNVILSDPQTFLHLKYPDSDIIGSVVN